MPAWPARSTDRDRPRIRERTRLLRPLTAVWPGRPYPLGATWDGQGVNFALFSKHAERVELCIFDDKGRHERQRITLRERTNDVWHCYLPEARPGMAYGYRVHGPLQARGRPPLQPATSCCSTPMPRTWSASCAGATRCTATRWAASAQDLSFDRRDSAAFMPKGRVLETAFTWGEDRRPEVPWQDMVIYELHVRGFTMTHPGMCPSTCAAPTRRSAAHP